MTLADYIALLPVKRKLSRVKLTIIERLWGSDRDGFPKPWVSSAELLTLTGQKYFDRRLRELINQTGCDIESSYRKECGGHAWRLTSLVLSPPQHREYLPQEQKDALFASHQFCCATCGKHVQAGVKGLQADHKIPISRGGRNDIANWQPLCHNCNVGKRRACDACQLPCAACAWAFPEVVGVPTILSLSAVTLRRIDAYSEYRGVTRDKIMETAAEYYLAHEAPDI